MKMTDSCRPHFFWQQLPLLFWGIAAGCLGLFLVCCAGSSWADGSFLLLLLLLSMLDIRYGLLFDRLLLVLAVLGAMNGLAGNGWPWLLHLGGALAGGAILWALRMLSHGGMGGGDIKLAFVLGFWLEAPALLLALWLAFTAGGLWAGGLLLCGRCQRGARLPFGPFLSLGAGLSYFYGSFLWEWYVGFCYG